MSASRTEITIKPFLILNGNDFLPSWKTGVKGVDAILKKKLEDFDQNHIKADLEFYLEFDQPKNKLVKFLLNFDGENFIVTCNKLLDEERVMDFVNNIDPYDSGPDTWMEGDIGILSTSEVNKAQLRALSARYDFENLDEDHACLFELGMIVTDVTPSTPKIRSTINNISQKSVFL